MISPIRLAFGALAFAIFYRLWRIIYHLYISPLRSFPGPKLWACSRLPLQIALLRGRAHLRILELHKKYGPVVRTAPDQVVFFTPQSFLDIYQRTGPRVFSKDKLYYDPPANGVDNLVTTSDERNHARQRRLLAPGFTGEALKAQEPLVTQYVDAVIQHLDKLSSSGPVSISDWFNATVFDIAGALMFGEDFECLSKSKIHPWIGLLFSSTKALIFTSAVKQYPALDWLLMKMIPQSMLQKQIDHFNLSAARVDRRIEMGTDKADWMSSFLKNGFTEKKGAHDEKELLSRDELHANAYIILIAGAETTATSLSGIMYYLCKSPFAMQNLVTEVRGSFANEDDINFQSTAKLTYLNAAINEGLRLYPPVAPGLYRRPPPGGEWVDGHFVPDGTNNVYTHQYATYHSPFNFHLPDEFHPERWLGNDPRFANDRLDCVHPFLLGPRGCLGKNLAYAEIRLVLAKLLFLFDVQLRPESDNWIDQDVYWFWAKGNLMVELRRRREMA